MKKSDYYPSLLHELNSPLASLQAILFVNQKDIDPKIHEKLTNHINKLIQTSKVISQILCPQKDLATLKNLVLTWLAYHDTNLEGLEFENGVFSHKINGNTTKKEYADLLWDESTQLAILLEGKLTKTKDTLTLTLPHHLLA